LPERGPIPVTPDESFEDLGQPKSGPARCVDYLRERVGRLELAVGGVKLGDTAFPPPCFCAV
jgi:hypothetical protein